jgi:uncharacterized protein
MSDKKIDDQRVIAQTKKWLETVIIAHNYCPFAKREFDKGSVRYQIIHDTEFNSLLQSVIQECVWLDQNADIETTLIILPSNLYDFNAFLDCLVLAEDLLIAQGYEGKYQIASFHPDYYFQGSEMDDPANYTNRSPHPMFHLIREDSIEIAVENHPDADAIPERNVEHAREQGLEKMKSLLQHCIDLDESDD